MCTVYACIGMIGINLDMYGHIEAIVSIDYTPHILLTKKKTIEIVMNVHGYNLLAFSLISCHHELKSNA